MEEPMKYLSIIILLALAVFPLLARHQDIEATFTPPIISVNTFATASFDPNTPETQPILTTLRIRNTSAEDFYFFMKVEVFWSGVTSALVNATYISSQSLGAGQFYPTLTNQDLITNQATGLFNQIGEIQFSLDEIVDRSTVLKNAVLAGYFPDGSLSIRISALPAESDVPPQNWTNATVAQFTINVRNAGVIHLISPGATIGNVPPQVSYKPVSFVWNAINTGFNDLVLTIREFPPNMPPTSGSVAYTGTPLSLPNEGVIDSGVNSFSEFLPFNEGYYYAWRVSTTSYSETNPYTPPRNVSAAGTIASNWNVFRYLSDEAVAQTSNDIQAILNQLSNLALQNLYNAGFLPTGTVIVGGRSYSGQEAVDLVESLLGRELDIRVRD